jgi:ACR3 family arsenite transporter
LGFFERYLSLWVALCMVAGVLVGKLPPGFTAALRGLEFGKGRSRFLRIAIISRLSFDGP